MVQLWLGHLDFMFRLQERPDGFLGIDSKCGEKVHPTVICSGDNALLIATHCLAPSEDGTPRAYC